jgi:hypothetical protein
VISIIKFPYISLIRVLYLRSSETIVNVHGALINRQNKN